MFPVSGQIVDARLGLKISDFGMALKGDPGSPSHFFWKKHPRLGPSTVPNSNSAEGSKSGITLNGFVVKHGKLQFKVTYADSGIAK